MSKRASLKRNVILNILGSTLPLFISIVTVPLYLKTVGPTRYGILALVWLFAGYFSLLDFGISRATVNQISQTDRDDRVAQQNIFWSAIWINVTIGVLGMCIAYPVAHLVFSHIQFESETIRRELVDAIPWLCLTIPLTVASAVGLGGLEARERFDLANLMQIFGSAATQIAPVWVAYHYGVKLNYLILTIVIARIASFVLLFISLKMAFPLGRPMKWDFAVARKLLAYGSWASVSGIISPVLEALDRFIIGAKLSAADVALYAVPFSVADKLRIIPRALARAAFPKLSGLPDAEARHLFERLLKGSLNLMTPMVLVPIFAAKYLLELWIGASHSSASPIIAIILLCGAWFNSIAVIPFGYMQARGRPNITARIHMFEFLPFVGALFVLVNYFGVVGAALAWSGRMALDCLLLCYVAKIEWRSYKALMINTAVLVASAAWAVFHDVSIPELAGLVLAIGVVFLVLNRSMLQELIQSKRGKRA
jgi:O-antigen/teichoic acid export membrane protein